MNKNQIYDAKALAASIVVGKNPAHVTVKELGDAAKATGLKTSQVKNLWRTFTETCGTYIDGRVSSKDYIGKGQVFGTPSVKSEYGYRDVTVDEAAEILLYYMNTHFVNSREVANKYKVSVKQIYDWIRELNVSGTLMGTMVLNPKKYGKPEVKDVIWMTKHPYTTRKGIRTLSQSERLNYTRVADVLKTYLTRLTNLDIEVFLKSALADDEEMRSKKYPKKEEKKGQ